MDLQATSVHRRQLHACMHILTAESIEAANTKGTRCRPIGFCHKLTWKRKSTFLLLNSINSDQGPQWAMSGGTPELATDLDRGDALALYL